jgi:hypothetical protein
MSITIASYSATKIYPIKPKEMKLVRQYEDTEYVFLTGDLSLELIDADDLYADVKHGEEVFIDIKKDGVGKFLGTFQQDGANYDPEKETHSFTAIHIAKKIFDAAKNQYFPAQLFQGTHNFDYVQDNSLLQGGLCDVRLVKANLENARESSHFMSPYTYQGNTPPPNTAFQDFLKNNPKYLLHDYWIDFFKHFRAIAFIEDDLSPHGKPVLNVQSRYAVGQTVNSAYDQFIAEYKENICLPQYKNVLFPCLATATGAPYPTCALGYYSLDRGAHEILTTLGMVPFPSQNNAPVGTVYIRSYAKEGDKIVIPDNCLDLRAKIYGDTWKKFDVWASLPTFKFNLDAADSFAGESPLQFCERNFSTAISSYDEREVLYSQTLPVNPYELLPIRGELTRIWKIEDDLMNETTKITGRVFAS